MNDYQRKMAQVLKTQAALNAFLHELWLLKTMDEEDFGDNTISREVMDPFFDQGLRFNTIVADACEVAHFG